MKKDTLLFLLSAIIFGTNGLIARYINVSSFFLVASRGIIAVVFIWLMLHIQNKKIDINAVKANYKNLLLSGLALGFMWIFLYTSYNYSVSISSLINNMAPTFAVVISAIIYKEKLTIKQILCVTFVLIGVLLVSGILEEELITSPYAFIFSFLSLSCFCINIIINRKMTSINPIDKTLVQMFISFIIATIATLITKQIPTKLDTTSILLMVLLGVLNTGIAYMLYYGSITTLPAYKISVICYIEPVVAIILGVLVLNEKMTILSAIGSVIIIVAACISELIDKKS